MHASSTWWLPSEKVPQGIGCVGAESNAPVDSNAGEPSRCTSAKEYFGAEDGTSIESSTGEPSCNAQLCRSSLVPQEQQCTGDWCSACRLP